MIFRSFALSSKDTTVKRQLTEWENIANHTFDERLLPRELTQQLKKKKTQLEKWTKNLNRHCSKVVQMANKCRKRCSTSLTLGKWKSKKVGCHLTPSKVATIKQKQ